MDYCGDDDPKRQHIRASAYQVLVRYGFQRTSMDDIAKEAGMSRPALYLHYKNKEQILRDLVMAMKAKSLAAAADVAESDLPVEKKLLGVVEAAFIAGVEKVYASPHGGELVNVTHESLSDILTAWRDEHQSLLARVIGGKKAQVYAGLLLDAVDGAKHRSQDANEMRKAAKTAIALIVGE